MRRVIVAIVLCLASVAAAAPADELLERGLRSYAVGRYAEAIEAFQRGYELEPRADFLYALGQAQRMSGDCKAAVASYRAYLRTDPPERSAAPARQNLERCERELAAATTTTTPAPASSAAPAEPAPTTAVATPAPPPLPRRRARDDKAAAVLAGIGGAALVAGGALWGVGEAGARSLTHATQYDQLTNGDAYDHERLAGILLVAGGGALVVGAVARWIWVARHR